MNPLRGFSTITMMSPISLVPSAFSAAAGASIKLATEVFTLASDATVVDMVLGVMRRSVEAIARSLGGAALIWTGIFTNGVNEATMVFVLDNLGDALRFLYDVVKPANVVAGVQTTGVPGNTGDGPDAENNPYNELDLRLAENRSALVHQVQRVALTLTAILRMAREDLPPRSLGEFQMDIDLPTDPRLDLASGTYVSRLGRGLTSPPREKWLFINGIANEFVWFQRSCDKIRDTFQREVKGIYNRSDGILWDVIECLGERSVAVPNPLIERTPSSKAAQAALERNLKSTLWPVNRDPPDKVVMIAHSQGCLVLRLALQNLVRENPDGSRGRADMKERLRVFTFASPSIDWRVMDEKERSLSEYTKCTEHFAHETDFVARLGVVTHRDNQDSGYAPSSVFYSKGGKGHLLGAHYPLAAEAYGDGESSVLLGAVDGAGIA